jgi:cytochrome c-type biogenesis protein CcmH/NrfF
VITSLFWSVAHVLVFAPVIALVVAPGVWGARSYRRKIAAARRAEARRQRLSAERRSVSDVGWRWPA